MDITTSQTIGPFSHEAWRWGCNATAIVTSTAPAMTLHGIVFDGNGAPVDDALIEAWQPASAAVEASHALPGFRRVASAADGSFSMTLTRPANASPGAPAAFITVFARGLGKHQFSAVFLADDPHLARAPILAQVPADRQATLIARADGGATYTWNIVLQGPHETVFFDYA